jgi:hypothetical protein
VLGNVIRRSAVSEAVTVGFSDQAGDCRSLLTVIRPDRFVDAVRTVERSHFLRQIEMSPSGVVWSPFLLRFYDCLPCCAARRSWSGLRSHAARHGFIPP